MRSVGPECDVNWESPRAHGMSFLRHRGSSGYPSINVPRRRVGESDDSLRRISVASPPALPGGLLSSPRYVGAFHRPRAFCGRPGSVSRAYGLEVLTRPCHRSLQAARNGGAPFGAERLCVRTRGASPAHTPVPVGLRQEKRQRIREIT